MKLLDLQGIDAGYGQMRILRDLHLEIAQGEFLGILGHNGMGKSTLLKTIMGHIKPFKGSIAFAGAPITARKPHQRARLGIGYVPQGRQIFPQLTVRENLLAGAAAANQPESGIIEMLTWFPRLKPLMERPGGVLSGGEQQLLALARCLCGKPRLLLLDEPTEGVQPSIRDEMVEAIKALKTPLNLTILLVEQNVRFMEALAERLLYMEKGRLQAETAAELAAEMAPV